MAWDGMMLLGCWRGYIYIYGMGWGGRCTPRFLLLLSVVVTPLWLLLDLQDSSSLLSLLRFTFVQDGS